MLEPRLLLSGLASLLAPPSCAICRAAPPEGGPYDTGALLPGAVCGRCAAGLLSIEAACRGCGRSRPQHAPSVARCRVCLREPRGEVRETVALLRYRGVGRRLMHRIKYGGVEELARPLGLALGRRLLAAGPGRLPADLVVVPVPLHLLRRLRRGFDQAAEIAAGVAAAIDRPCLAALRRRRWTRPLFRLPHGARPDVVQGAFAARAPGRVRGRPVLLVDDIRTSGATLRAAAQVLRAAGAARVMAAVVAR